MGPQGQSCNITNSIILYTHYFLEETGQKKMVLLFTIFFPCLNILDMGQVDNKEFEINVNLWKIFLFLGTDTWHAILKVIRIYYFNM
jgi:hypothetical protein